MTGTPGPNDDDPSQREARRPAEAAPRGGAPSPEDLTGERVLANCRWVEREGGKRPCLGGLELLARLGRGGMGVVYYAVNPRLDTELAIKVLPRAESDEHDDLVGRFVREAQIAAKLRSDHLVGVIDVNRDEDSGHHFLVMEYVRGQSAGAWLRGVVAAGGGGVPEEAALDVVIAATKGLAAAHLAGIVHRDIKPDNILVPADAAGRLRFAAAKLADLGLARPEAGGQGLTGNSVALGTPGFMAPEQAKDAKLAKKPADVFATGATLYTLLAGKEPFAGATAMDAILATIQQPHTPIVRVRPDVSPATAVLLDHCLAKDAAQRYPDAPALLEALELCRTALARQGPAAGDAVPLVASLVQREERGERVRTDPPAASRVAPAGDERPPPAGDADGREPSVRRSRAPFVAAAVLVAAAAAVAAWMARRGDEPPKAPSGSDDVHGDDVQGDDVGGSERAAVTAASPAGAQPPAERALLLLTDVTRWDAASPGDRRAVAAFVASRNPAFEFARCNTFASGDRKHEMAIFSHAATGLDFVLVPGGTFAMGSPNSEAGRVHEETRHSVTLTRPFLIARTECTQAAYEKVTGSNPSAHAGANRPVEFVSWEQAAAFCAKAGLSLPTEAQWEYACRAGTTTAFGCGDAAADLAESAWYEQNSGSTTHNVGGKRANAFGLRDCHGNVREWCEDGFGPYPAGAAADPRGPAGGAQRIVRGGSFTATAENMRSAHRFRYAPDAAFGNVGFRPAAPVVME